MLFSELLSFRKVKHKLESKTTKCFNTGCYIGIELTVNKNISYMISNRSTHCKGVKKRCQCIIQRFHIV